MLNDELIAICDKNYKNYADNCGCAQCNHPSNECSGSCYNCLYEIHYPLKFDDPKKSLYNCQKMMYHYVCQYSYIYASEILYAYNEHKDFLQGFDKYNIMSIACGACPDLMALECFCNQNKFEHQITYRGYDLNPLWSPIHTYIKRYCDLNGIKRSFFEKDVITHFEKYYVSGTNIIVISYLISYLYNTEQTTQIESLFNSIADNVVLRKDSNAGMLIIINDVNSNKRGRDYFSLLPKILKRKGLSVNIQYKYFDNAKLNYFQRVGTSYAQKTCLFPTEKNIIRDYHIDNADCRSVQLILEVT